MPSRRSTVAAALFSLILATLTAPLVRADDHVNLFLGFTAEAEFGGFMQARAAGIYKKYGIDTDITFGNPQTNSVAVMASGKADFTSGTNQLVLNAVREHIPLMVVAGIFQRDPRILLAHKGVGNDTLESLKGKPILVAAAGRVTFWPWLRNKYGFSDDQIRPYSFSQAAFLADNNAIEQGFITNEPFAVQKAGVDPQVLLLADYGLSTYASTITVMKSYVDSHPDLVQRFVNASIEGWYSFLYGDPAPGIAFLKANNPDMEDDQIAYAISQLKSRGIVDSGDAKTYGIGAMTDERWTEMFTQLVDSGLMPADLDYREAYTLKFVNKKVGMGATQ